MSNKFDKLISSSPIKVELCTTKVECKAEELSDDMHCFGCYDLDNNKIVVSTDNKNTRQMSTTFLHELCHYYFNKFYSKSKISIIKEEFIIHMCVVKLINHYSIFDLRYLGTQLFHYIYLFKVRDNFKYKKQVNKIFLEIIRSIKI